MRSGTFWRIIYEDNFLGDPCSRYKEESLWLQAPSTPTRGQRASPGGPEADGHLLVSHWQHCCIHDNMIRWQGPIGIVSGLSTVWSTSEIAADSPYTACFLTDCLLLGCQANRDCNDKPVLGIKAKSATAAQPGQTCCQQHNLHLPCEVTLPNASRVREPKSLPCMNQA